MSDNRRLSDMTQISRPYGRVIRISWLDSPRKSNSGVGSSWFIRGLTLAKPGYSCIALSAEPEAGGRDRRRSGATGFRSGPPSRRPRRRFALTSRPPPGERRGRADPLSNRTPRRRLAFGYPFGVFIDYEFARITVVETETDLARATEIMSEAERTAVIDMIAADPRAGDLIQGTGGMRKVRVPLGGKGKRGGARLITFFHDANMPCFLITVYAKNVQADLDPRQRKAATALTDAIRAQFRR
ncbi:type II toxin-antitoxin system RelE/ParE family toxin [Methylosinus sp. PW1]|uniref:type II toxin-antitoxin system RelE/ParE family toxin n=1 Tax=Methylosinus sp. PW1 TaxID=107636 RepID=UPI001FD9C4E0|nr:type II toxin-antitoxin system RelE/ParE family toxin [Methylosinus sp. PW1]